MLLLGEIIVIFSVRMLQSKEYSWETKYQREKEKNDIIEIVVLQFFSMYI